MIMGRKQTRAELRSQVREYLRQGRDRKDVDFSHDDKILRLIGQPVPARATAASSSAYRW
jgi:hypothetical protein